MPACPLRARGHEGLWRGPPILTLSALPFILSLSCVTWLLAKSSDLEGVLTHPMEGPCSGPRTTCRPGLPTHRSRHLSVCGNPRSASAELPLHSQQASDQGRRWATPGTGCSSLPPS